jgi:hypothetical protein
MGKMELMTSMDSFPSKTYTQSHVQRMTICPAAANNSLTPREVNKKNAAILKVIARNEKNKINIKTRKFASKYRLKFAQPFLIKINDKLQRKARKKTFCGRALPMLQCTQSSVENDGQSNKTSAVHGHNFILSRF